MITCTPANADSIPRITDQNTALRSLVIPINSPHLYICHLPVYIKKTLLEEVRIFFLMNFEEMRDIWTSLDQLIFQSLAEDPRESFTLHLDMSGVSRRWRFSRSHWKQLAQSLFPLCDELGILKYVFDDVDWRNRGPVLSRLHLDDLVCGMSTIRYFRHPSNRKDLVNRNDVVTGLIQDGAQGHAKVENMTAGAIFLYFIIKQCLRLDILV